MQRVAVLMGGALSAPTLVAMLESCKSGAGTTAAGFPLSAEKQSLLAEIADVIIPKTNTPGAKEAGVGPFIEKMLKDCYTGVQQKHFLEGLDKLEEEAQKVGGKFVELKNDQKVAVLKTMETASKAEDEANKTKEKGKIVDAESGLEKKDAKAEETPAPFFKLMKELTLFGYFTSEIGCKEALAYDPIPGAYLGCIPLEKGQKAWAL